jgi:hypothetical protein
VSKFAYSPTADNPTGFIGPQRWPLSFDEGVSHSHVASVAANAADCQCSRASFW